ncbi:uncharacterized protein CDV56_100694 [Aspergillus thermomutatus]|uniref:Uncharacterized protein n=1 Tax=Aspergillus thermomutatus TaxID=41047 RepID=A0A397G8Z6_ASPTH|nr:uncharacterized protein CDV56_100694 [Aspergillus thermomutatus]RHZ46374.1 hypothetical protein CDV56_100694 [Aspergillus thermomutatus]
MLDSASSGRNARHHQHQQPPPIIPPSPTLSNPDMILPFDVGERESSTPSPPFNLPSLSHLQAFYENKPLPSLPGTDSSHGAPYPPSIRPQKKNFPRHTWLQDSRDASRRLSDIGEEDAGSSPHKGGGSGNLGLASRGSAPKLASSPVLYEQGEKETRDHKAWSSSSGSTVGAVSELSLREVTKNDSDGSGALTSEEVQGVTSVAEEKGPDDEFSSAILESEAERILENAKKKLTLMEGNLSRARSSMRSSPSLSSSPSPSAGTQPLGLGQPVGGLYQSISRADRRASALRPRATYTSSQDSANNRHSRVYSETNLPSTAPSNPPSTGPSLSRSLSAMGSSTSSNFHNDERSFHYEATRAYLTHRASVSSMQPPAAIQRAHSVKQSGSNSETPKGLGITSPDVDSDKTHKYEEFNSAHPSHDPPSRAQSQLQVRDLQDQMKGLHIKISSLKVKAQEDNLRRRSLQSLRTPSPFTEGDQWYPSALELKNSNGSLRSNMGRGRTAEAQEHQHHQERQERETVGNGWAYDRRDHQTEQPEAKLRRKPSAASHTVSHTDHDDRKSINESLYEDAEEGEYDMDGSSYWDIDREALEEILREPLDDEDLEESLEAFPAVPQHTEMTPHEEREDAFDYEHFILHSALGNYSQSRLRRTSNVSTSSVETTRPFHEASGTRHSRSDSTASLSTIATFATATEGEDDLESVLYWDRKFNDELRTHQHYTEPAASHKETDSGSMGTPRASRKQASHSGTANGSADVSSRTFSPVQRSDSATSSLVSSLVSTVRAASSPHPNTENGKSGLNNDDTRLLEQVFRSLGKVCLDLQTITASAEPDPKRVRVLRRRLDAARRVLDGELDA